MYTPAFHDYFFHCSDVKTLVWIGKTDFKVVWMDPILHGNGPFYMQVLSGFGFYQKFPNFVEVKTLINRLTWHPAKVIDSRKHASGGAKGKHFSFLQRSCKIGLRVHLQSRNHPIVP